MNKETFSTDNLQEVTDYAVNQLRTCGETMINLSLIDKVKLLSIKNEIITKSLFSVFRKHGTDNGWKNVSRATYFRNTENSHLPIPKKLASLLFPSSLWLPKTTEFSIELAESMRKSSESVTHSLNSPITSLSDWDPNRIGINRMNGSCENPAEIADHTDVISEVGAVVVLEVYKNGLSQCDVLDRDNLTVIFSKNTCDEFGLDQPVHNQKAINYRLSTTFADLR